MIWTKINLYLKAALVPLLLLGAFLLRLSGKRDATRKIESKINKAKADHAKVVMESDLEIDIQHDTRSEEIAEEIEEKKTSSELEKPNEW